MNGLSQTRVHRDHIGARKRVSEKSSLVWRDNKRKKVFLWPTYQVLLMKSILFALARLSLPTSTLYVLKTLLALFIYLCPTENTSNNS